MTTRIDPARLLFWLAAIIIPWALIVGVLVLLANPGWW